MIVVKTLVLLATIACADMLQLRCRVGQTLCTQLNWGYTGRINRDVVCCPTVSGQGFTMNMGLTAPDNCKCRQGTEEEYANAVAGMTTTTNRPSTELRCRVGQTLCTQLNWGYTGRINRDVVCCPTVSGQGFTMNMGLTAPDNCKCRQGTEEEYANAVAGLTTTTNRPSTELRCRVGQTLCTQLNWGYTGRINRDVVCCPTVSGQGITMNMGLIAPDNCKCRQGTEEEYANAVADRVTNPSMVSATTSPTPTTRPGTGNVTFNAHCSFPNMDRIACHIDSDDPNSSVHWALIMRDGQLRYLGHCNGLRGGCRSVAGSNVTLSRQPSWSVATLRNSAAFSGSLIYCSASHRGQYRSDLCRLDDPTVEVRDCIRGREECNSRDWQRNTGSINGQAVCCSPRPDNLGLSIVMRYRDHTCLCPA